jgi:transcriptional regulator with XRE-family HTH domain
MRGNLMYFYRLKNIREDKELSQKQIAELLNMKQQQYARYEKGINEIPFEHIIKLAKFYNVSIDYLANLTDEEKPYKRKG